jgi:chloramphenicol 3-O-phosphotransferase
MNAESIVPVTAAECATVIAGLEPSLSSWLVGIRAPDQRAASRHQVRGGDLDGFSYPWLAQIDH